MGTLGVASVAAAGTAIAPKVSYAATKGARYAMVIDTRRCSGCHACSVSCKSEYDVPLGGVRSWVEYVEYGDYPDVKRGFLPRLCNQCGAPPCVDVCPIKGATYKRESDGIVVVNDDLCNGCAKCVTACPYDARFMNPTKGDPSLTKGVGVADKCDFCLHRIEKGVAPACVNTCPGRARVFGDLNDPDSEVKKLVQGNKTVVLLRDEKTKPRVFYIGADYVTNGGFKDHGTHQQLLTHRLERSTKRHDNLRGYRHV
ncbi:MAG: 4Fe-4S dicluster domain-containing protein [Alphaproteobacteria bacterium]|nr:4Fe-4S dicluster domain-containing protein [Alphaproteobacteria bacterium]